MSKKSVRDGTLEDVKLMIRGKKKKRNEFILGSYDENGLNSLQFCLINDRERAKVFLDECSDKEKLLMSKDKNGELSLLYTFDDDEIVKTVYEIIGYDYLKYFLSKIVYKKSTIVDDERTKELFKLFKESSDNKEKFNYLVNFIIPNTNME